MNNQVCHIFAAGDFQGSLNICSGDYIIAADAGYHHLEKMKVMPHLLLGDFDTIGDIPEGIKTKKFPPEKDFTDTELAVLEGINLGYKNFVIYGAIGGKRLEHTIANIKLLEHYTKKGINITLTDGKTDVIAIHNCRKIFSEKHKGFISLFSLSGNAKGVMLEGFKYDIKVADVDKENPTLFTSNEFLGKQASIEVENGIVTVIYERIE